MLPFTPEPCLCGALDCEKCRPGNRYQDWHCDICDEELVEPDNITDIDDEACVDCKGFPRCPVCNHWAYPEDRARGFAWSELCGCTVEGDCNA